MARAVPWEVVFDRQGLDDIDDDDGDVDGADVKNHLYVMITATEGKGSSM